MYTLDVQLAKVFISLKAPCESLSDHSEFICLYYNYCFHPSSMMIE